MATELETFRDHCRKMADPTAWAKAHRLPYARSPRCFERTHTACEWGWQSCKCTCHDADRPKPPTDEERALWTRLADEVDAYLAGDLCTSCGQPAEPDEGLFFVVEEVARG